jgi:hypothetical protein
MVVGVQDAAVVRDQELRNGGDHAFTRQSQRDAEQ